MESLVNNALSADGDRSFYGAISSSTVHTFADMTKKTKIKGPGGKMQNITVNPELIFRRALALAKCRDDITLEAVLSHPVGCVPLSLFHDDGTMRKSSEVKWRKLTLCQIETNRLLCTLEMEWQCSKP